MDEGVFLAAGRFPLSLSYELDDREVTGVVTGAVRDPLGNVYATLGDVCERLGPGHVWTSRGPVKLLVSKMEGDPFVVADYYPEDGEAVVWVGTSFSHCSACGGNANPHESGHFSGGRGSGDALAYVENGKIVPNLGGCQAPWVRRVMVYAGDDSGLNLTDMSKPMSELSLEKIAEEHERRKGK
jgi:hypothetical protein